MSNIIDYWKNEWDNTTSVNELFDSPDPKSSTGRVSPCQSKRNSFPTASSIDKYYPKPYNKNPPNC